MKYTTMSLLCALLCLCCACNSNPQKYDAGSVVVYSDEGFKYFMEQEREVFEYQFPNAFVLTHYMSEADVIDGLLENKCVIGITSRKLDDKQLSYMKSKNKKVVRQEPIAIDAVALIVNKDNPVGLLSVQEIKDLFSGEISSWRQLGVNDTVPMKIVFDCEGSANVSYIKDNFLAKGASFGNNVFAQKSNQDVINLVERDRGAIGFVSVSWLGANLERVQSEFKKDNMDSEKIKKLEKETDEIVIDFTDKVKILKVRADDEVNGYTP